MLYGGDEVDYIKKVLPLDDYRLEIQLESGSSVRLNLKEKLQTMRFRLLLDNAFFNRVTTDGVCILWEDKIEISLSETLQLAHKQEKQNIIVEETKLNEGGISMNSSLE